MDTYHGCLVVVKYKVSSPGASRARNEVHAGRVICRVTREAGERQSQPAMTTSSSNQECPLSAIEKVARCILLAVVVVVVVMIKMLCYFHLQYICQQHSNDMVFYLLHMRL